MDHPMTGYALRKAFTNIVGDAQAISFGTLYPLLDKLEQARELVLSFKETENKRPQKLATITAKGQDRFKELAAKPVSINKQTKLTFLMKVHFLHLFDYDLQVKVLEDFQKFSTDQVANLKRLKDDLDNNPHMVQADINDGMLVKEFQISQAQMQLAWVNKLLQQRKGE